MPSELAKPQNVAIRGDLHKRLKTKAAALGVPLQEYVAACALFGMLNKDKALKMVGPKEGK